MELHFTEETEGMNWLVLFVWKMRERLYIKSHEKLWKRTLKIKKIYAYSGLTKYRLRLTKWILLNKLIQD